MHLVRPDGWTREDAVPHSIAVGTSGWSYDHWEGVFYPEGLPHSRRLEYYLAQFPTVEVNYSFYRLPSEKTITSWHDAAPDRFRYSLKGSRYITHVRRLKDAEEPVATFVERVTGLKESLGVILWQLPPTLDRDIGLLGTFLEALPSGYRHAIEFRDESWLTEETFELLEGRGVAFVCVSSEEMPDARRATAEFVYVRFHGLDTGYDYDYSEDDLRPWADFLCAQSDAGRDGFVFFNNDAHGNAPRDARTLVALLGDAAAPWGEHAAGT